MSPQIIPLKGRTNFRESSRILAASRSSNRPPPRVAAAVSNSAKGLRTWSGRRTPSALLLCVRCRNMRVPETPTSRKGHSPHRAQSRKRALPPATIRVRRTGPALFRLSNCKLHGFDPQAYFGRRAQQARQSLARLASRRAHALGLAGRALHQRSRDAPNRAAKNQAVRAVRSKDRLPFLGVTPVPLIVAGQSAPAVASRSSQSRGAGGPAASLFEPADGSCLSLWRPAELLHFLQIGHPIVD
jgi:hypothetical protein